MLPAGGPPDTPGRYPAVIDLQVGTHVFLVVLIFGTLWRLLSFHAMASANPAISHAGKAMSIQY